MPRWRVVPVVLLFACCTLAAAYAQEPIHLVADRIYIDDAETIVAEGDVEILFDNGRLKAAKLRYDRAADTLFIDGPMILTEGERTIILANSAELSADLRSGIMTSARLVFDRRVQIGALEISRSDGRHSQLHGAVASSCRICAGSRTPFWEIRSSRVIHDQQERQLYFDNAQLRVMGLPVFYTPRLRLPDPTLERATGFLIPRLRSTSRLGTGVKLPYFIRMGDHRDLTLTPYLSSSTTTLEYRYRQAFRKGNVRIAGAVSDDDILRGNTRGYLFADGEFELPRDYRLGFDLEHTSDNAYLLDYGFSGKDRLDSALSLARTRRDLHFGAAITHYKSLRAAENNREIPSVIGTVTRHMRFDPAFIGGRADLIFDALGIYRRSSAPDGRGRDTARMSGILDWRRDQVFANGTVGSLLAGGRLDYYASRQNDPSEETGLFGTGAIGAELRWPMVRESIDGSRQLIEPVVQLLWTGGDNSGVANEDSPLLEFDEGNLFAFSRFAGADRIERGLRANLGATWTRFGPDDQALKLTMGRIVRFSDTGQFTAGSGLTGRVSDWLAAAQLDLSDNLTVANRSLFDNDLDFTRSESRIAWRRSGTELAATYIWLVGTPAEDRPRISEWTFDSAFELGRSWRAKADWRYDFFAGRAARAGAGLEYETECVKLDLSLSRRFTSSANLDPVTDFSLSVSLTGFGGGRSGRNHTLRCRG